MADIEKESLEAHVELCSERYRQLHDKLDAINNRLDRNEGLIADIHKAVTKQESNRNKQLIGWGSGVIATLAGAVAYLIVQQL